MRYMEILMLRYVKILFEAINAERVSCLSRWDASTADHHKYLRSIAIAISEDRWKEISQLCPMPLDRGAGRIEFD